MRSGSARWWSRSRAAARSTSARHAGVGPGRIGVDAQSFDRRATPRAARTPGSSADAPARRCRDTALAAATRARRCARPGRRHRSARRAQPVPRRSDVRRRRRRARRGPRRRSICSVAPSAGWRTRSSSCSGAPSTKKTDDEAGVGPEMLLLLGELFRERRRHAHAAVGVGHRVVEGIAPREVRALAMQGLPAAHRARDGHRVGSVLGHDASIPSTAAAAGSAPAGARPLALSATTSPAGCWTKANRSPPTPHMCG